MTTPNPTAQQLRETTLAIWWLCHGDREAIGVHLNSSLPGYLRVAYHESRGSPGMGWLWVGSRYAGTCIQERPDTPLARLLRGEFGEKTYAGIVIRDVDIPLLKDLPGIITDLKLRRY